MAAKTEKQREQELFEKRMAQGGQELEGLCAGARGNTRAQLEELMTLAHAQRPVELTRLDKKRDKQPDWYSQGPARAVTIPEDLAKGGAAPLTPEDRAKIKRMAKELRKSGASLLAEIGGEQAGGEQFYSLAEQALALANLGVELILVKQGMEAGDVALLRLALRLVCPATALVSWEEGLVADKELTANIWSAVATRDARLLKRALDKAHGQPDKTRVNLLLSAGGVDWALDTEAIASLGWDPVGHVEFLKRFFTGEHPGSFAVGGVEGGRTTGRLLELCAQERVGLLYGLICAMKGLPALVCDDGHFGAARAQSACFGPLSQVSTWDTANDAVLAIVRRREGETLVCLFNFSEAPQRARLNCLEGQFREVFSGEERTCREIDVPGLGAMWLSQKTGAGD